MEPLQRYCFIVLSVALPGVGALMFLVGVANLLSRVGPCKHYLDDLDNPYIETLLVAIGAGFVVGAVLAIEAISIAMT